MPEVGLVFCNTVGRPDSMSCLGGLEFLSQVVCVWGRGHRRPQANPEFTILRTVCRRKSLPARDSGFTLEDICMLSESQAPADFPSSVHFLSIDHTGIVCSRNDFLQLYGMKEVGDL